MSLHLLNFIDWLHANDLEKVVSVVPIHDSILVRMPSDSTVELISLVKEQLSAFNMEK